MRTGNRRGNALIEFSLSVVLLTTVFGGAFEYGYAIYTYNMLVNAVRDGARYASLKPYDSATSTPSSSFQTAIQDMVVYGDPSGTTTTPIVRGLTTSNVQLAVTMGGSAPSQMTVSITGFSLDAIFGTIQLSGRPSSTFPYLGIPTPP